VSGDDEHDDTRARLTRLFALADQCIDAGFDVFPAAVWARDDGTVAKAPLLRNGHLGAHRDRQTIRQQLIDPPHQPSGVPDHYETVVAFVPGSGGCGCLDCDVKHGKAGKQALADLVTQYQDDWLKAVWNSPSGGANILFHKAPGKALGNTSPWPGIDVRADNGWVVAPGNVTSVGAWTWKIGGFTTAAALPGVMADQLVDATTHTNKATNAETGAFIDASPESSSYDAQRTFGIKLTAFRQATEGSRHGALLDILSWCGGMVALDLRWALEEVKRAWLDLTDGEGREDEVADVFTWVVGQELRQRAPAPEIATYQAPEVDIFIDWHTFAQRDATARPWLVEGLWPAGRAVALWANAKEGKSELALWCAARIAMGMHPWYDQAIEPLHVAYFDYEMTEDDLDERLNEFGFDLDRLDHLHYALLPPLPALNLERGGDAVLAHALRVGARAVIIDTFARSVTGEENSADTANDFYTHTGSRLKQAGIGVMRTDHAGKSPGNAPRGSSAKLADVDVSWRLTRTQTGVTLTCASSSRLSWVGPKLVIERVVNLAGEVGYTMPVQMVSTAVTKAVLDKVRELDDAGVPLDAGRPAVVAALKAAGKKAGNFAVLGEALKRRRERAGTVPSTATGGTPSGTGPAQSSDGTLETAPDQANPDLAQ